MKALAVDSSVSAISFAACCADKTALLTLDIGMHQSEKILEGIQCVLSQCGLHGDELDFTALCSGPGTFTGLRLAFSALKALSLAHGIPVYAVPTWEVIAYPYRQWPGALIPAVDAKKQSFYAAVYRQGVLNAGPFDADVAAILDSVDPEEKLLIAGNDADCFADLVRSARPQQSVCTFSSVTGESGIAGANSGGFTALTLLELAGEKFRAKEKPLEDYDGPVYIRKSEAELSLAQKTGQNA